MDNIQFQKLKYCTVFTDDFCCFEKNNEIQFKKNEKIAVIYGPNGTGKTSFIRALTGHKDAEILFTYDGVEYTTGDEIFYIINDQNDRNIIKGEAKDFLLGDNIRREFELKELIGSEREKLISKLKSCLQELGIKKASCRLIDFIKGEDIQDLIKDIANNKSKGKKYSSKQILQILKELRERTRPDYEEEKLRYYINDILKSDSLICELFQLAGKELEINAKVEEIEENTEAIKILSKYKKIIVLCAIQVE